MPPLDGIIDGNMGNRKLDQEQIVNSLDTEWLGQPAYYYPELDSTNEVLLEMAADETNALPAGAMVITDYQRQGRGRMDRRWESPPGKSLLFSLLFRPIWPAEQASWLTMIAALAVAESIEALYGLDVGLKWPNDVVIRHQGAWRKCCGMLPATGYLGETVLYAVMGIGLNVNIPAAEMPETDWPATSMLIATGRETARLPLLATLLRQFEHHYADADKGLSPQPKWNERMVLLGWSIRVSGVRSTVTGIVEGTGPWGELLVRDEAGTLHEIAAGDVSLREPQ